MQTKKYKCPEILIQLFRYTFVGGFAFIVDFGLLYVLTEYLSFNYLLSASLSFIAGLIVNYVLSILWVFDRSVYRNRLTEFIIFSIIGGVGLLLNAGFMYFFTENVHLHYLHSKIISAILVFLWNFFARKFILFNGSHQSHIHEN